MCLRVSEEIPLHLGGEELALSQRVRVRGTQ